MDEEFLKERALHIRNLADKADPFIKRRLLDLAMSYEGRVEAAVSGHGDASFNSSIGKHLISKDVSWRNGRIGHDLRDLT